MTISRNIEGKTIILIYLNCTDGKVFLSTEPTKVQMALEKVLQFTTGSRSIPPLGFDSSPTINFCHDPAVTLPMSNTCSMSITLPTAIINVDTYSSRMTYGIGNSLGCLGHVWPFSLNTFQLPSACYLVSSSHFFALVSHIALQASTLHYTHVISFVYVSVLHLSWCLLSYHIHYHVHSSYIALVWKSRICVRA